jgi:hypothetical protein
VYHAAVLSLLLVAAASLVPVEGVVAVVNGVPVLDSDVELAEIAKLVPGQAGEGADAHTRAVIDALIALELRWQDLVATSIADRTEVDMNAVWNAATRRAGGVDALRAALDAVGLEEAALRNLLRHAAVVQAYVATRFAPFARPSEAEIAAAWKSRFAPALTTQGKPVPPLTAIRDKVAAVLTEEKLLAEVNRWTSELEQRGEVVRYTR